MVVIEKTMEREMNYLWCELAQDHANLFEGLL